MSVRPEAFSAGGCLSGSDGELLNVRVCVQPRLLEGVLEALNGAPFPVNPQIYHDGGIGYVHADGTERRERAIMVEFPVFSERLDEVRGALGVRGVPPEKVHVRSMLEELHSDYCSEAAPEGAGYSAVRFYKRFPAAGATAC